MGSPLPYPLCLTKVAIFPAHKFDNFLSVTLGWTDACSSFLLDACSAVVCLEVGYRVRKDYRCKDNAGNRKSYRFPLKLNRGDQLRGVKVQGIERGVEFGARGMPGFLTEPVHSEGCLRSKRSLPSPCITKTTDSPSALGPGMLFGRGGIAYGKLQTRRVSNE